MQTTWGQVARDGWHSAGVPNDWGIRLWIRQCQTKRSLSTGVCDESTIHLERELVIGAPLLFGLQVNKREKRNIKEMERREKLVEKWDKETWELWKAGRSRKQCVLQ